MDNIVEEILVPASEGRGIHVKEGQLLDVIDVEGRQVGDLVAYCEQDSSEYLSPTHTVSCNASVRLGVGYQVFSNHRNPVFTILRDDVEKHDIVVPCCDFERFFRDYGLTDHKHCLANLEQARDLLGLDFDLRGEQAWNVFMHNRITDDGLVVTDPAQHEAGSTITLKAHHDLVVLLSACPQDLSPCNNFDCTPMLMRVREE